MSFLQKVRQQNPLVHNITNVVVTNFTANGLLALGASPFMAYAHEEVADVAAMAGAVMLNMGTLDEYTLQSILLAGQSANRAGVPVVFDPVGAGATPYRTAAARQVTEQMQVDILRSNIAELAHVAGAEWTIRGVDAGAGEGDRVKLAQQSARQLGTLVVVTGQEDIVTDGETTWIVSNGHELLTRITGAGCLLSSVVAAFAAVSGGREYWLSAATEALAFYGTAAEIAAERTAGQGTGSFQIELINQLSLLTPDELQKRARIEQL
ncbi:hydroxyethylthiazole kinase [Paenibacillus bovis]|uniref:Hydroxyethylthiazole kinase n=1 Tax=Paenibacillus bovis TaxID=1616788 RepID=A0A172ZD94_9BACL|nr:hydroxyethylthiazole kinase [Paenibacillus bovis]ANF95626.1 hydroxyethylthiazole kinase [Paenibacillus bovis]